jgi:hypothetical protein
MLAPGSYARDRSNLLDNLRCIGPKAATFIDDPTVVRD